MVPFRECSCPLERWRRRRGAEKKKKASRVPAAGEAQGSPCAAANARLAGADPEDDGPRRERPSLLSRAPSLDGPLEDSAHSEPALASHSGPRSHNCTTREGERIRLFLGNVTVRAGPFVISI
ncbi:hypothetical protein MTO96_010369 [Rhipicephalus appendiculatus]